TPPTGAAVSWAASTSPTAVQHRSTAGRCGSPGPRSGSSRPAAGTAPGPRTAPRSPSPTPTSMPTWIPAPPPTSASSATTTAPTSSRPCSPSTESCAPGADPVHAGDGRVIRAYDPDISAMKVVIGIGNPERRDQGVGPVLAERLAKLVMSDV